MHLIFTITQLGRYNYYYYYYYCSEFTREGAKVYQSYTQYYRTNDRAETQIHSV